MNETQREIVQVVRELMTRLGAERLMMGSRMFEAARTMILASFPAGLSEVEIRRRLCKRLYGADQRGGFYPILLKAREQNDDAGLATSDVAEVSAEDERNRKMRACRF